MKSTTFKLPFLALLLALLSVAGTAATFGTPHADAAGDKPVAPPSGSRASSDLPGTEGPAIDPRAAAALARQKGMTISEATARLVRERALDRLGDRIESRLAGRSGGDYLDADGKLVVTTLDARSSAVVATSGARAKRVDDSSARLNAITDALDRQAARNGAGEVQGWYVDVPTNTVVATVTEGATDPSTVAMKRLAASFGDSVRIEYRPATEAPRPAEWLVGGYDFRMPNGLACSVGFNTLDAYNRNVVLTAGHCTKQGGWMTRNGYAIGQARTANYPGDDFGTFWNSYPSYWQPSPSVYNYGNGTYPRLAGQWNNPPVGAVVCKSGRTTGYTCGTITALNTTVTYTGGYVLYGLVEHTACVEGGDSGGANISAGNYALGVTSGSSTPSSGPYKGKCLSKTGKPNVSWYQPIGEALSANGLRLVL
jgi:hypothetical protein